MDYFPAARGFTLVELALTLVIIAILAAIITPIVASYADQSRIIRAQADTKTIADAITRFQRDVGEYPMFSSGSGFVNDSNANLERLEGPGGAVANNGGNTTPWTDASGTSDSFCQPNCLVGTLIGQLAVNSSSFPTTSSLSKPFNWKGPYMDIQADPWARRYLVNIIKLKSVSTAASFVLSAGPNGIAESDFTQARTATITPAGDDIIFRIK